MNRYFPIRVDLHIAIHEYGFGKVILIYVPPCQDGFLIMKENSQYQNQAEENLNLFQKGDIFTRHGTSMETMFQQDIQEVFARRTAAERELWKNEIFRQPEDRSPPLGNQEINWQLAIGSFSDMARSTVRNDDQSSLRGLFNTISGLTE